MPVVGRHVKPPAGARRGFRSLERLGPPVGGRSSPGPFTRAQFLFPPRKGKMPEGPNPLGVGIDATPGGDLRVRGGPLSKADQARANFRGGGSVFGEPNPLGVGIKQPGTFGGRRRR